MGEVCAPRYHLPSPRQMRCAASHWRTPPPPLCACRHGSHISAHASPAGWWVSRLPPCHGWRHRVCAYISVPPMSQGTSRICGWLSQPRLTLQHSPIHHLFTALPTGRPSLLFSPTEPSSVLQRAQSYGGRPNVSLLSRSSGSPLYPTQWDFPSLGDEAEGTSSFSLLPGVLPGSLTPQIFRNKTKKDQLPYMFHPVLSTDSDSAGVRRRRDGSKWLSMFAAAVVHHHRLRQWKMRRK